jgi:hypothetical protein
MRKERLPIASPCTEDWDAMDGDERRRSCQKCDKEVVNLSELTGREVERLFQRQRGQDLCVRYAFDDAGNLELRPSPTVPLIPAALLVRGREVLLGTSLAVAALDGCNPAGPAGDALLAREAIRAAAEKMAETGTCTVSMEPVLPLEVRLHAAPCVVPLTAAPAPPPLTPIAEAQELPKPSPPPVTVPALSVDPKPGSPPATEPCHKPDKKPPKYPHKLMGKPIFRPTSTVKNFDGQ